MSRERCRVTDSGDFLPADHIRAQQRRPGFARINAGGWFHEYQTLIAGGLALAGVAWTVRAIRRQIDAEHEAQTRARKWQLQSDYRRDQDANPYSSRIPALRSPSTMRAYST